MLGKWLCTKQNPSGIHKAISEVRQSWNVGVLHVNRSRATTSFQRTSQPRREDDCTWFTQKWTVSPAILAVLKVLSQHGTTMLVVEQLQDCIAPVELCEKAQRYGSAVIIERAWHEWNEKCLQRRTISNESYQLKVREQCLHSHSKARHWVDVSNRSRLKWKQKLAD